MTTLNHCRKNPNCQLWQVLCDGKPCVVETEIESSSQLMPKSNKIWHLSRFKLKEIIDLAVKIEKSGIYLYKKLARKTSNRQIKNVLLYLASEEGRHQAKFWELGRELAQVIAPETYPDQHFEYIRSTIETHIFNGADNLERLLEKTCSDLEVINLAIDFEKDTILFLNGFRNLVLKDKQELIDELIIDEQANLVKLVKLRKDVILHHGQDAIKRHRHMKNNPASEVRPLVI